MKFMQTRAFDVSNDASFQEIAAITSVAVKDR